MRRPSRCWAAWVTSQTCLQRDTTATPASQKSMKAPVRSRDWSSQTAFSKNISSRRADVHVSSLCKILQLRYSAWIGWSGRTQVLGLYYCDWPVLNEDTACIDVALSEWHETVWSAFSYLCHKRAVECLDLLPWFTLGCQL